MKHIAAADFALRLNLDRAAGGYRGTCPACGYRNPFSLRAGKPDASAWSCACCGERDDIVAAVRNALGGT